MYAKFRRYRAGVNRGTGHPDNIGGRTVTDTISEGHEWSEEEIPDKLHYDIKQFMKFQNEKRYATIIDIIVLMICVIEWHVKAIILITIPLL